MNEVEEVTEQPTEQPVTEVEYDYYKYQPKDDKGNSVGPEQTIKYPKGNWEAAMEIMAKNHSATINSAMQLRQEALVNKIKEPAPEGTWIDYGNIEFKPRDLTDDEAWTISQHPESAEARRLIFESELGASPEVIRSTLRQSAGDLVQWRAMVEAQQFMAATPEWKQYQHPDNSDILIRTILESNRRPTKANYLWAFNLLRDSSKLTPVPTVTEVTPPNAEDKVESGALPTTTPVTTQPVLTASGLNRRNSSSSGTPITTQSKWTVEQINKMSGTEYEKYFRSDVAFRKFVDDNAHLLD